MKRGATMNMRKECIHTMQKPDSSHSKTKQTHKVLKHSNSYTKRMWQCE